MAEGLRGEMTVLDQAYAALQSGGEAEALVFWHALADVELFLVLEAEAVGEVMAPRVFDLADGPLLLAFDSEERLAGFSADPVPYAALPGRVVAGQLAGQGLGLGLNLGSGAVSEAILPVEAMEWLAKMLAQAEPEAREARISGLRLPHLPPALLAALRALVPGQAAAALAEAEYQGGGRGHVLAFAGLEVGDEARMARTVTEALAFSGVDAAALDVVFLKPEAALFRRIAEAGQVLEPLIRALAVETAPVQRQGPGTDPMRPPRLK